MSGLDWLPLLAALGLWLVVMRTALRRSGARWAAGLPLAITVGAAAAVAVGLASPVSPSAPLVGDASIAGVALLIGCIAVGFAWPLMAMRGLRARG
jgi:hypothetical protein